MNKFFSDAELKSILNWYKYECADEIEWTRFGYKQAWFSQLLDFDNLRLFKSYNTIVALVDISEGVFYELGKWSTTTSKQVTQFYNAYYRNFKRVLKHVND